MVINLTQIIDINDNIEKIELLEKINFLANEIKQGKIAILPTSTIYGICTNAFNEESVKRIYDVKKRDVSKPLIVLVNSKEMLNNITYGLNDLEEKITEKFWPGPLTVILKKKNNISDVVTANKQTLGVRWDSNFVINKILEIAKVPIVAPSANISGHNNADSIESIEEEVKRKVDYIVNIGKLTNLETSTLIQIEKEDIKILREGRIKKDELIKFI